MTLFFADLWELPQPQLTASITDETEKNFYSRCPPEKRPQFMNKEMQNLNMISQTSLVSASKDTARDDKQEYEPDMEKVQSLTLTFERVILIAGTRIGTGIGTGTRTT